MTLTKAELADLLFEKVGLNKREAKDMVESFFEEVRDRAGTRREREAVRLRQLPAARQAAASRDAIRRPARRFRSPPAAS